MKYNHAFDFAFEVTSENFDGSDVTPSMLRSALIFRALTIDDEEIIEACGAPFDTMESDA